MRLIPVCLLLAVACGGPIPNPDGTIDPDPDPDTEANPNDADGDGHEAASAGGDDCDDSDPDVYPGAPEVWYDGVDQQCDGVVDDGDQDGDGVDAEQVGGLDCMDTDPRVTGMGLDFANDGLDNDCDGVEGDGIYTGEDAAFQVSGVHEDTSPGWGRFVGEDADACDLDGDGKDDLLVLSNGPAMAHVSIWYGATMGDRDGVQRIADPAETRPWQGVWSLTDADAVLSLLNDDDVYGDEGETYTVSSRFADGVACADIDGDGHKDVVVQRLEVWSREMIHPWSLSVFYGTGAALDGGYESRERPITDENEQPVGGTVPAWPGEVAHLYDATSSFSGPGASLYTASNYSLEVGDVDGDGAAEIMATRRVATQYTPDPYLSRNWSLLLHGERYVGSSHFGRFGDGAAWNFAWAPAEPAVNETRRLRLQPDLDGDGRREVSVESPYGGVGTVTVYDGASLETPFTAGTTTAVRFTGPADDWFGYAAVIADVDGDGENEAVISALYDDTAGEDAGAVYVFDDVGPSVDDLPSSAAANKIAGAHVGGSFGITVVPVGDVNGDGAIDVGVSDASVTVGATGHVYILDGAKLLTATSLSDAVLLDLHRVPAADSYGYSLRPPVVGDFDGDGRTDFATLGSYLGDQGGSDWGEEGRVSVYLSGR